MNETAELKIYLCRCFNIGTYSRGSKVTLEVKHLVRTTRLPSHKPTDRGPTRRIVLVLMNDSCLVAIGFFHDEISPITSVCIRTVFIQT